MTFTQRHRWVLLSLAGVLLLVLVLQAVDGGVADPTADNLSGTSAAFNSGLLVFREGLESVLVLAAITAGLRGRESQPAPADRRRGRGRSRRDRRDLVPRRVADRQRLGADAGRSGRDRAGRDPRAARRHQLVLPPHLLDGLDQPSEQDEAPPAGFGLGAGGDAGADHPRLRERLSRGLRDRPLPAEHAHRVRHVGDPPGHGDRGCARRRSLRRSRSSTTAGCPTSACSW